MVSLFLDRADELVLSSAMERFRHAADDLWRAFGDCASTLRKVDVEDYPDPFETLQSLRTTVHHYHGALIDRREDVDEMIETFEQLEYHVDSSAMKYGHNRLPTELLSWIFLDATSDMESTVTLSHVCKLFRSVVNGSPAIWQRFRLSSRWAREQILAIAERSAFRSLKADIRPREIAGFRDNESDSVDAIFSLRSCLEELSTDRGPAFFKPVSAISQRFAYSRFAAYPVEMPLLRTLEADFLPHSSLARNLIRISLDLLVEPLTNLLDFLSCTNALQELNICVLLRTEEAKQEVFDHKPLRLPELIKLSFGTWEDSMMSASIIAQKICSSSLRILALQGIPRRIGEPLLMKTTSRGPFQDILQSNPSFTELELCTFTNIDLCHIPSQAEVLMLTVKYAKDEFPSFKCSGTVSFLQIRLIRFRGLHERVHSSRFKDCVYRIREILLASGLNAVQFEFQNCPKCIDGSFNLEDFRHAFLDEDDYIDYDFY